MDKLKDELKESFENVFGGINDQIERLGKVCKLLYEGIETIQEENKKRDEKIEELEKQLSQHKHYHGSDPK